MIYRLMDSQKARARLAKAHLKVSRQRKDFAVKLARCVVQSNDVIAYEDLRVKNLVENHCLAKSINDAAWYQFREWIEYFGVKIEKAWGENTSTFSEVILSKQVISVNQESPLR
jgi:IS605 OrfB family transposase